MSLRLLTIDPQACEWDDMLTYDVEVRNIGRATLTLPWTRIPPAYLLPPQPLTVFPVLMLSLEVGEGLGGTLGHIVALYGDPSDSFTVRQLPPQTSVVIRAETPCRLQNSQAGRLVVPSGTTNVKVSAVVRLTRAHTEGGVIASSADTTIAVSRHERR